MSLTLLKLIILTPNKLIRYDLTKIARDLSIGRRYFSNLIADSVYTHGQTLLLAKFLLKSYFTITRTLQLYDVEDKWTTDENIEFDDKVKFSLSVVV